MFVAKKAVRQKRPLKVSLEGTSGSGKTFTALRLAFAMMAQGIGSRVLVFDTENESASLYADVECDGRRWEFETVSLGREHQNPTGFASAYRWAVAQGYDILIFDSMSHAWHGALDQVDQIAVRGPRGDKFGAWSTVTPQYREMIQTLTDPRAHVIATMRVKSEYENFEENGKRKIRKVGTRTDQRENTEYEFDLVLRLEAGNECHVEKVRGCTALNGRSCAKPGPDFWRPLFDWWQQGAPLTPTLAQDEPTVAELDRLAQEIASATGRSASDWLATLFAHLRIDAASAEELAPADLGGCIATSRDKLKALGARRRSRV